MKDNYFLIKFLLYNIIYFIKHFKKSIETIKFLICLLREL